MSNPLLKDSVFTSTGTQDVMTVSGTINKSLILWLILTISAIFAWTHPSISMGLMAPALIIGFVLAMITIFKKAAAPVISPFYALCEGFVLGAISLMFEKSYNGIVLNAILLTVTILFCMLAAYKSGLLRATPAFKKGVIIATFSIFLVYIVDIVLNFAFSSSVPYLHSTGFWGMLISVAIVSIAAFNLIIDFDIIEQGARSGAPKYMEWYGAFALMVTLIWLYLEVLRLLAKSRN